MMRFLTGLCCRRARAEGGLGRRRALCPGLPVGCPPLSAAQADTRNAGVGGTGLGGGAVIQAKEPGQKSFRQWSRCPRAVCESLRKTLSYLAEKLTLRCH